MYEIERTTETQCPRCGGVALLNSSFCSYCGSALMENASPQFYMNDPAAPLPALPPESAALSFPIPARRLMAINLRWCVREHLSAGWRGRLT